PDFQMLPPSVSRSEISRAALWSSAFRRTAAFDRRRARSSFTDQTIAPSLDPVLSGRSAADPELAVDLPEEPARAEPAIEPDDQHHGDRDRHRVPGQEHGAH